MAHQVNWLYDVCLDGIVSRQVSSYEEDPRKKSASYLVVLNLPLCVQQAGTHHSKLT
jgi:hypothetical protein